MGPVVPKSFYTLALAVLFASYGLASPRSSRLLSLVPPGADAVAGFQNHHGRGTAGRLLLTTHNNRLDLDDWQALTGSDSQRKVEEVIQVAVSNATGNLSEHLLLVAGRFDRENIFRSLELAGSQFIEYQGQRIVLIEPFARERGDMVDTRWFVILDNSIGILGTSGLVRHALQRHADHSLPDPVLEERLSILRPDVTCWNVLSHSRQGKMNFSFAQPHSAWAELQQDTDLLVVGTRFGPKTRIDFSIHAQADRGREFFTSKAAFFTDAMVAGPEREPVPATDSKRRVERFSVGPDHVQGSVELSSSQFEAWCEEFTRLLVRSTPPTRGD